MPPQLKQISKLLSLVLRHQPGHLGIQLDEHGWTSVPLLLEKINQSGTQVNLDVLEQVVAGNDKARFEFSKDKTEIRARQGHSVNIELQLLPVMPPEILYHGTIEKVLDSIFEQGLLKGNRHHVHLSKEIETAKAVGGRRGKPVILLIDAKAMHENGFLFFLTENKVWLTDRVPAEYIRRY